MSENNEVVIRLKQNGLYDIIEELTIAIIADDVNGLNNAIGKAKKYLKKQKEEGFPVEYGLRIIN